MQAKNLIKKFFSGVKRCESEADWKHLTGPHSTETSEHRGMGGGWTMNGKVEEDNNLGSDPFIHSLSLSRSLSN